MRVVAASVRLQATLSSGLADANDALQEGVQSNGTAFNIIQGLSQNVFVPVGLSLLAIVLCYELIDMFIEKNNMNEVDTFLFFKWVLKAYIGIQLVQHSFDIVNGLYEVARTWITVTSGNSYAVSSHIVADYDTLIALDDVAKLASIWLQIGLARLVLFFLKIYMLVAIYTRLLTLYLYAVVGAVPLSTFVNKEWGQTANNYLKNVFSLALSGAFMILILTIYGALLSGITFNNIDANDSIVVSDTISPLLKLFIYSLAAAGLIKMSKSISDSIIGAH